MNPPEPPPLVYVSITVDDLGARGDPDRSDRVSTYRATPDEVRALLEMVRRLKGRPAGEVRNSTDAPPEPPTRGARLGVVESVQQDDDGLVAKVRVDPPEPLSALLKMCGDIERTFKELRAAEDGQAVS